VLYRLYASPEKVSTVALQPGEELTDVSTGDTVRWVVGDTVSGQGSARRVHLLVKPTLPDCDHRKTGAALRRLCGRAQTGGAVWCFRDPRRPRRADHKRRDFHTNTGAQRAV
jgi:hypothetical protein